LLTGFRLPTVELTEDLEALRQEVRDFINKELETNPFEAQCDSWMSGFEPEFSKKLGAKGWLGITVPEEYGGVGGTNLERYVITEELLAAGAPVAAHWIADRQTAPLLLSYGSEEQKKEFLPQICRGEIYFSIGLSEPNAGSDLAAISSRAIKDGDEWVLNGQKIWTSNAHHNDYMIVLCRTEPKSEDNKYKGISQLLVDLRAPGVTVRPIKLMTGEHHFNEVFFEDVRIPDSMVVGELGNGWKQSMAELAYERSGPERFLSTFPLFNEVVHLLREKNDPVAEVEIGRLLSQLSTLRKMSLGVANLLEKGETPDVAASLVKDMGTKFEKDIGETARLLIESEPSMTSKNRYEALLARTILQAPGFTLRGGTTEILRSIIARGLGV
jgi:alkylation response protein AidB-like acyl-CoA dehydrogenase